MFVILSIRPEKDIYCNDKCGFGIKNMFKILCIFCLILIRECSNPEAFINAKKSDNNKEKNTSPFLFTLKKQDIYHKKINNGGFEPSVRSKCQIDQINSIFCHKGYGHSSKNNCADINKPPINIDLLKANENNKGDKSHIYAFTKRKIVNVVNKFSPVKQIQPELSFTYIANVFRQTIKELSFYDKCILKKMSSSIKREIASIKLPEDRIRYLILEFKQKQSLIDRIFHSFLIKLNDCCKSKNADTMTNNSFFSLQIRFSDNELEIFDIIVQEISSTKYVPDDLFDKFSAFYSLADNLVKSFFATIYNENQPQEFYISILESSTNILNCFAMYLKLLMEKSKVLTENFDFQSLLKEILELKDDCQEMCEVYFKNVIGLDFHLKLYKITGLLYYFALQSYYTYEKADKKVSANFDHGLVDFRNIKYCANDFKNINIPVLINFLVDIAENLQRNVEKNEKIPINWDKILSIVKILFLKHQYISNHIYNVVMNEMKQKIKI